MRNPYIVGPPVYPPHFYGRQALAHDLLDERYSCIYLMGNRRIGKTSLLHHLEMQSGCIALFLDLQAAVGDSLGMKRQVEYQVRRKAQENPALQGVNFDERGDICDAIMTLAEATATGEFTMLLLWDEAEKLLDLGLDRLERLVGALRDRRFLRTILAATRGLAELNDRYRSKGTLPFLFGFRTVYLPPLSNQEAAELICQVNNPEGQVQVTEEIQSQIIELTGNHPYLIQMLCNRLFDNGRLRPITNRDLTIDRKLAAPFQLDYDGLSRHERSVLRLLAERDAANEDELCLAIEAIDMRSLRSYLMGLEQSGYIRYQNGSYRIANHFLHTWLKTAEYQETPMLVSNQASLEVLSDHKRQTLEERRVALDKDYQATSTQLNRALSDVERFRLKQEAADFERQIQEVEGELEVVLASSIPPKPTWKPGRCLTGLGAATPWPLEQADHDVISTARIEMVKLLAPSKQVVGQGAQVAKRLIGEGRFVIARLFEKPGEHPMPADDFVASVVDGFEELYQAGVRYFEIHNEPNLPQEGLGVSWANGEEFAKWFSAVYDALKVGYVDAQLGYPGLSPQTNMWVFLDASEAAIQKADWIGVRCYWQNDGSGRWGMLSESDGMLWKQYRTRWPNKLIFITEFSNNSPSVDYATKGQQYVQYYNLLRDEPNLAGACAFALYCPGEDTNHEGWRTSDGITEIAQIVGKVTMAPHSVLVVDKGEWAELLTNAFKSKGYRVQIASTLQEAIEQLEMAEFDAVVLEPHLSKEDYQGARVLAAVDHYSPLTPCIIVSGFLDKVIKFIGRYSHLVYDVLTKGRWGDLGKFNPVPLLNTTSRAIEHSKPARQLLDWLDERLSEKESEFISEELVTHYKYPSFQAPEQMTNSTKRQKLAYMIAMLISNFGPDALGTLRDIVMKLRLMIAYNVLLLAPESTLVGGEIEVAICLNSGGGSDSNAYLLEILRNEAIGNELNVLLTAPGFRFEGDNAASLPLDPAAGSEAYPSTQIARFHLAALRPGPATITAELYRGDIFETTLKADVQVTGVDEARLLEPHIVTQPRPVSQPDIILQVQTEWNETGSECILHYTLNTFSSLLPFSKGVRHLSQLLPAGWGEQMRSLLETTLHDVAGSLTEAAHSRLSSLGKYLFQKLMPAGLQSDLSNLMQARSGNTLMIQADQDAWPAWELLHNGQAFLGERFIIGRWPRELDAARLYEFPLGAVNVIHYAGVEQPETWMDLLGPPGASHPLILPGGMLGELGLAESLQGLHLIRCSQTPGADTRRDAPVPLGAASADDAIEHAIRPAKLNLRRNRPLVTLGYLNVSRPELTTLEQTWAPTFVRARCSAFVGPLWAVQPKVEAAFVSGFYAHLWAGDSLGGAFHSGRRLARSAVPDSLDWLAYTLWGDPMARPYRPVKGQGYAAVEAIGRQMDDPLSPGVAARFRVSLRRTPPVWHHERVIEVTEELDFDHLQLHVLAFGLQVMPDTPIDMIRTPAGDYWGWFNLVAPPELAGKSSVVRVHFVDGETPVHSLTFSLKVGNTGGDPV